MSSASQPKPAVEVKEFTESDSAKLSTKINVADTLDKIYEGLSHDPELSKEDIEVKVSVNANYAFGELTFSGVNKMCDAKHLDAAGATVCYDLGMGLGRMIIQVFLQFPNLKKVVGVELCPSRAAVAFTALRNLAKDTKNFRYEENSDGTRVRIIEKNSEAKESKDSQWTENLPSSIRYLERRRGDLFACKDALEDGQIIVLEIKFQESMYSTLAKFLSQFKKNTRIMSYYTFSAYYGSLGTESPWSFITTDGVCPATWGSHMFYFYYKN